MVELEHLALNYGTAEPQHCKNNCTLHRHNTYTVLTIPRNHRTKVVAELENLALNYGAAEPQHYKKNCTLQRHNTYTVLTILRNHRTKVVVELENLALNYETPEPHYTEMPYKNIKQQNRRELQ